MFHPKHVLSSLKNIGKMNFKSIVRFIKAINIYIYIYIYIFIYVFLFCFVLFCFVLFCFVCFVLVWFCLFVFVLFLFLLWGQSLDKIRPTTEEWFPTRVQLSSVRLPFCNQFIFCLQDQPSTPLFLTKKSEP